MTIAEASQLVLQASSLSKGGEIFLLDMGQPILIKELAEQMIKLSGKEIKNNHLKHMHQDIDKMHSKLDTLLYVLLGGVGALALALLTYILS